ncbi:MAG: hypothetical protein Q7T55_16495, partial [Solirubrobacteraceae bacterium]|nr:hypothetical protein [Solirubrobacteraceae bacterium]
MTLLPRRTRSAIALTALAAAFPLASASSATAAPQRTAATSTYTSALYLQSALGLPASETNPAIESVTLDRFQWILQQDGKFPILIGDPASDPSFAARAQDVEAAADAAGIKDVYWFNPNLSGNAKVGATTVPPLDIRNPEAIKSYLENDSAVIFGDSWLSLVGQYLGNGVTAGPKTPGAAKIVATKRTATVNDAGATPGQSTEVGNASGGALYDYTTSDPADATESYFLIYDKAR